MNPDQIAALIQDFEDRASERGRAGNQEAQHYYEVAAQIVRDHLADAQRAATR
jgi:hypothetical protein